MFYNTLPFIIPVPRANFRKKNQENFANEFFLRCECQQNGGITCRSLVSVTIEHVLI